MQTLDSSLHSREHHSSFASSSGRNLACSIVSKCYLVLNHLVLTWFLEFGCDDFLVQIELELPDDISTNALSQAEGEEVG